MTLHGKYRVRIGDTEIETNEFTLNLTNDDYVDAATWEASDKAHVVGLTDTHGSFSGVFEDGMLDDLGEETEVALYGPALLPWYRAWWIRNRGKEWPDVVIAHGPAHVSSTITRNGDETRITGTFNQSGRWTFSAAHDQSWSGKWERFTLRLKAWRCP